ncbi:unnamed protein product [Cylicocyclus nassatus]|uniref:Lin-15A/B-like domain-containing protein n=1 Tax=Cylicocyclus nassatus TaxID=53992 RepID=A0AA36GP89_CYLNA|nr:unnamed protein product [Cylicocyclus nassatus]
MEDSESDLKPHVVHIKSEMDPLDFKTSADIALLDGKAMHIPSIGTADSKPDAQTVYEESDVKPSTSKNDGVSALEVMKLLNPSIDDVSQPKEPTDSAKGRSCALCLASPSVEDLREVNSQEQLLVFLSGLLLGSEIADDVAFRIYKENHAVNSYYCRRHFSTAFLHIAHEVRETAGQTSVHDLALASGAKTGLLQRIRKITTLLDAEVEISGSDLSQFYWNCQNDYADQGYEVEEEVSRISMATRRKSYTTIFKLNASASNPSTSERAVKKQKQKPKPPAKKEGHEEDSCCVCLICGKSILLAESRFISKASNRGVILVSCLLMGYALPMKVAKLVLEEGSLTRRSCRRHFVQASFWLYETVKHALHDSEPPPDTFGVLPLFIKNAIVMRIQECATLFGDYSVTENEVQLFYNDCQMRHFCDSGAIVDFERIRKEAGDDTAASNSGKSTSGKQPKLPSLKGLQEHLDKDLSQHHLAFKQCCLCDESNSIKHLQETPLTMSVLIVLLSCLHANDKVTLEKAKEVFISGQKPEKQICNEHFFWVAAYLRAMWEKRYGDLTQISFQRLHDLLDDENFSRLVGISNDFVEGHTPLRRSCLTIFFKWYRESYFSKKTRTWRAGAMIETHLFDRESVQRRKESDEQDDIVEIPTQSEQQTPKTEDIKSAFSLTFDERLGIDGDQSASARELTTCDLQPSTSRSEPVKQEPCTSVDEALEDEIPYDSSHDNGFCTEMSAEDLLHTEDIAEDGEEEKCPVAEFEDLTQAKTEKSDGLSRIEEVVDSVSKGKTTVPWPQPTPQIFAPPSGTRYNRHETIAVSATTLQSIRAPKRKHTEDLDATELLKDTNIHLVEPRVVQYESPTDLNEKRTRFEIISSLSIRNRRAPFLSGLITYASKRIYFDSRKRLLSKHSENLPGPSILYTIWWSSAGILYQAISQEDGKIPPRPRRMTSTLFQFQLNQVVKSRRFSNMGEFGPILLCDEPRSYFDSEVIAKLHDYNIEILPYPPNSKDLLPSHYYFFEQLFQYLRNKNYRSLFTLKGDLKSFICTRPPTFFADAINELKWRWDLCIANKGEIVKC